VTGVFVAHDVEALAPETGELGDLAVPAALAAQMLVLNLAGIFFCGFRFFLSHKS